MRVLDGQNMTVTEIEINNGPALAIASTQKGTVIQITVLALPCARPR